MDKQPTMSRPELEAALMELFKQLSPPQKKIALLQAMMSAACKNVVYVEEVHR